MTAARPARGAAGAAGPVVDVRARRWRFIAVGLLLVGAVLVLVSVSFGTEGVTLTPIRTWRALWWPEVVPREDWIATHARAPRVVLAVLAGMSLGAAGALLQALFRNPLATPEVTGVTQGATTATVMWIAWGPVVGHTSVVWVFPLVAAVGAVGGGLLVWGMSRLGGHMSSTRLILTGVLVGGVLSSMTTVSVLLGGAETQQTVQVLTAWLVGSLALKTWTQVQMFGAGLAIALPLVLASIARANVLQLGDEVATGLGVRREPSRVLVLFAAAMLTATVVCTVGGIGFIGLIAPHLTRRFVGTDLRRLVPASALAGATLLLLADLLARNLRLHALFESFGVTVAAITLPAGVYMSLIGIPFFLVILRRSQL